MQEKPEGLSVKDLSAGLPGARVLWLHDIDRWYLGDFLRHAAWPGWLSAHLPGASIDLASHPAYLPLYRDDRFGGHLDVTALEPAALWNYDLVVVPSAFPPAHLPDPGVRRLLRTWDTGWALYVRGRRIAGGSKNVLNYFRAAHPYSLVAPETGGEWDCEGTSFRFTRQERQRSAAVLAELVPGDRPVLVYNPSASNPFTRQTDVLKEVENSLGPRQHAAVLRRIADQLPGHDILVAAPVKPGDQANAETLLAVAEATRGVHCLLDLPDPGRWQESDPTTLRGFAALLAGARVCGSAGVGTGSNTHLAALAGTWSLSFERAADEAILDNWSRPGTFQMGSFRWRNPSPLTAIHLMRWDRLGEAEFARAAQATLTHHQAWHLSRQQAFSALDLTPSAWLHHTDFRDEMAYLNHLCDGADSAGLEGEHLLRQLYRDSNLHKLARRPQVLADRTGVA